MCKFNPKNDSRKIDSCMRIFIKNLNSLEIKTLSCCCGHGKYPMTVIVKKHLQDDLYLVFELFSGIGISRKRKFYKKDKEGFYFIPEVSEGEKK